jgi:hypothetical protein
MREHHAGRIETPLLPATASSKRLGDLPLSSARSRAVARSLLAARMEVEEERRRGSLDGLAERLRAARSVVWNHESQ